jgi:hypothetical protein
MSPEDSIATIWFNTYKKQVTLLDTPSIRGSFTVAISGPGASSCVEGFAEAHFSSIFRFKDLCVGFRKERLSTRTTFLFFMFKSHAVFFMSISFPATKKHVSSGVELSRTRNAFLNAEILVLGFTSQEINLSCMGRLLGRLEYFTEDSCASEKSMFELAAACAGR